MKNPEEIIVCTNDSLHSRAAIAWAAHRSMDTGHPLAIVHVVDDRWMAEPYPWLGVLREMGEDMLTAAVQQAKHAEPSVSVRSALLEGSIAGSLRKVSEQASMVVLGSGSNEFPRFQRALQVAAAAVCPVAVINGADDVANRRGIVVGVDGSEQSVQAVGFAAAEADRTEQELTVVYALSRADRWIEARLPQSSMAAIVNDEERIVLAESVAGLSQDFPDLKIHRRLVTDLDPAAALADAAASAALLVVGSRGRGGFRHLLLGSTAHGVLGEVRCPTLITRTYREDRG